MELGLFEGVCCMLGGNCRTKADLDPGADEAG